MGAARQILHKMAWPNLMRRYDLEPGEGIGFEILFELVWREPGIRWRDVVEGLRRASLQRAWRVHCGRRRRALETGGLLDFWQQIARNGRDVVVENEGAQAIKLVSRCRDQPVGSRMLRADLLQHGLDWRCWIELPSRLGQGALILMQLRVSNIEQSVRRNVDHLAIGQALGEQVGAEREIAICLGFKLLFEIGLIILESGDRGSVGCREFALELLILHGGEGGRSASL